MKTIVSVTGDFIVDRNILPGTRRFASESQHIGTRLIDFLGGSGLTCSLINSMIAEDVTKTVKCRFDLEEPRLSKFISDYPERTAYSAWTKGKEENEWKIDEIIGYGYGGLVAKKFLYTRKVSEVSDNWIIIDEGNLGFRNSIQSWPDFKDKNVVLKCSYPFHEGALWQRLYDIEKKPATLIIIITLSNLRKSDVKISSGISWEQTALDITSELVRNKKLRTLLKADHLVVMTGTSGALHVQAKEVIQQTEISLIFDPFHIEGEWETSTPLIPGAGSCFLAAFAHTLAKDHNKKPVLANAIEKSIKSGLETTRIFCRAGFYSAENRGSHYQVTDKDNKRLGPLERIFSKAFVPHNFPNEIKNAVINKNNQWSILRGNYLNTENGDNEECYIDLACELTVKGAESILFVPVMTFGRIASFDRRETESYRNIKKLMVDFAINKKSTRPLNLAVFGAPGSGKSFAVKEMSRSFLEKFKPDILEFNLSQFKDTTELSGAFHAIRDSVLSGKLPVVFWDEFDSGSLSWLKSLLAPMQDGQFQDGKDSHPIGKAIFIFAGGTSATFENFDPRNMEGNGEIKKQAVEKFILDKGPDFASRIHGFLNVCGPNPSEGAIGDVTYPVRRAMFIRNGLGLDHESVEMDYGLLRALLSVRSYKNGARSLDRLLSHLRMNGKKLIVRSDLPSDELIEMNTSFADFCKIMHEESLEEKNSSARLAPFIHNAWMGKKVTDSSFFKEFAMLSNEQRLDNIASASRIKDVLAASNMFVLDDRHSDKADASEDFIKYISTPVNIESMAEQEHNLWMNERVKWGWKKGKKRSDYFKIHPDIEDYNKLSEKVKDKDRDTIRKYPEFLEGSVFKIVRLEQ